MAKSTRNSGKQWTSAEVRQVRDLAKQNTPTRVIGLKIGRSEGAVRTKAADQGISLKPTNQSPYGTKKRWHDEKKTAMSRSLATTNKAALASDRRTGRTASQPRRRAFLLDHFDS
jgi:hypothetical protein